MVLSTLSSYTALVGIGVRILVVMYVSRVIHRAPLVHRIISIYCKAPISVGRVFVILLRAKI